MSDNEDLLGDDLGDHSLTDYNLGNEEEEQLLADDYDLASQNVPTSVGPYRDTADMDPSDYSAHSISYSQPMQFNTVHEPSVVETECIVPNISVEIPNPVLPDHSTYAQYKPPAYEPELAVVPAAIPAAPAEPPQIVPSEMAEPITNGDRERFVSERPPGAQRLPQVRNIPDSLDKVYVPRAAFGGRGRNTWRAQHPHHPQHPHQQHPYRRNNVHRMNFVSRPAFPLPPLRPEMFPDVRPDAHLGRPDVSPDAHIGRPDVRPDSHLGRPDIRPDVHLGRPDVRPDVHLGRPDVRPDVHLGRSDVRPDLHLGRPDVRPEVHLGQPDVRPDAHLRRPDVRPDVHLGRPDVRPDAHMGRPDVHLGRPDVRPDVHLVRPDVRPDMHFGRADMRLDMHLERSDVRPDVRLGRPDMHLGRPDVHVARLNVRHDLHLVRPDARPNMHLGRPEIHPEIREIPLRPELPPFTRFPPPAPLRVTVRQEQEVRMLPVLPPLLPPGKKVLINPHFKGNFQPPVEGLPAYIPTRIHRSPPTSPTLEIKFGPAADIDEAAERFIAEQRSALARAAARKFARREPQRYIENTTIEIENELARRSEDDELLRRQEEFINANRAGLRRRMRSPSPPPRRSPSPSPRRSPERRPERAERPERRAPPSDEDTEYRRRLREQESLRERVLRAKEVRRRKNAVLLHRQLAERERECRPSTTQPDTTRRSSEPAAGRSPPDGDSEVNSTCDTLTPPRAPSAERALTPPLPPPTAPSSPPPPAAPPAPAARPRVDSDDELDLILDDIDGILSDDDDKDKGKPVEPVPAPPSAPADLRAKLPPRPAAPAPAAPRPPRQKITFGAGDGEDAADDRTKKEKSPLRRTVVTSSTKPAADKRPSEVRGASGKPRPRIKFDGRQTENDKDKKSETDDQPQAFHNRRVVLQRKTGGGGGEHGPAAGIFSRAVRTALGTARGARVEYSDEDESPSPEDATPAAAAMAAVTNLPHGITDTRLKTLAGPDVQSLELDREGRSARIAFRSAPAAAAFRRKFHNKMVAASRLSVTLC